MFNLGSSLFQVFQVFQVLQVLQVFQVLYFRVGLGDWLSRVGILQDLIPGQGQALPVHVRLNQRYFWGDTADFQR
jgi:hypothetical protein